METVSFKEKSYNADNKKYKYSSVVLCFLFLFTFILLSISIYSPAAYKRFNHFNTYITTIVYFMTLFFTAKVYKSATKDERKILRWLAWINIGLYLNGTAFFFLVYLHDIRFFNADFLIYLLNFIPMLTWFVASIVFLSKLLLAEAISSTRLLKILFPCFIVNLMMIYLLLSSTNLIFPLLSWQCIIRIPIIIAHFIIFDLAIFCLMFSKHKGLSFLFVGLTILVSGDIFIIHSSLSQTTHVLVYGELLWTVGLLFILLGMLTIEKTGLYSIKNWCNQNNTMQIKLTFWTFSACFSGVLLFFTIAFFFSIVDKAVFLGLPIFLMLYSIPIAVFSIFIGNRFGAKFKKFENNIKLLMHEKNKLGHSFSTQEFMFLQSFIIEAFEFKEDKNLAQKKLTSLAAQVAHDIRSPLSALNTCLKHLPQIPENQRILIRNAANRINDIANNLLQQYTSGENSTPIHLQIWLLAPLLENIISEKRLQFDGQPIQLEAHISSAGLFAFAKFDLKEMSRLLSNLINNAADALTQSDGQIILVLDMQNEWISLQIKDNGHGISEEKIADVLKIGISFKKGGSGLALAHAKETIEAWDGSLHLYSAAGQGTTIDIQLPTATPPQWFTSELIVTPNVYIAILDDDQSVHDAWDQRLNAVSKSLNVYHFKTLQSFIDWYQTQSMPVLVFSDYELLGKTETGLEVLEKLQIGNNAILVTSHYENPDIVNRCQSLGIRFLPKNLLAHIPIKLT